MELLAAPILQLQRVRWARPLQQPVLSDSGTAPLPLRQLQNRARARLVKRVDLLDCVQVCIRTSDNHHISLQEVLETASGILHQANSLLCPHFFDCSSCSFASAAQPGCLRAGSTHKLHCTACHCASCIPAARLHKTQWSCECTPPHQFLSPPISQLELAVFP